MTQLSSYLLFLAVGFGMATAASQNNQCFFPDGTPSPTDFVCNSTTGDGFSSCCGHQSDGSQAYCMSNGLCLSDMFLSRGSCTDKSWNSKNCAQVCTKTKPGGGIGVRPCGYTGKWDCGDGSGCSQNPINIPTGNFELSNAQIAAMGLGPASSAQSAASAASPASGTLTSPNTVTQTVTTMPSSGAQQENPSVVGAAVGIPLGILACSFLGLWLYERRNSTKIKQQLQAATASQTYNYGPPKNPSLQGSSYSSYTAPQPGISRMASSHSAVMSPASQLSRGLSTNAYEQAAIKPAVKRAPSSSSQPGVHPAYQQAPDSHFTGYNAPPPPPKTYEAESRPWIAEAPANEYKGDHRGHQRTFSSVQELPAEQ